MTKAKALETLKRFNEWRRGGDSEMPDPKDIGDAINFTIRELAKKPRKKKC